MMHRVARLLAYRLDEGCSPQHLSIPFFAALLRSPMAKIYFADDDPDTRTLVVACLEQTGHEVECFANGASLLSAFRRSPCDLAVLDVMMPGMSGLETLSELRRASSLPVLLLTAKGDPDDQCEGLDSGPTTTFPSLSSSACLHRASKPCCAA